MGAIIHKEIADGLRTIRNYIARFKYDGGTMLNSGETTRKFYKFLKDNNIPTPVFSYLGDAATKLRTSGISTFATKAYSLFVPQAKYGPELVTNGTFDNNGVGWTGIGESTVNTGVGRIYSSAGALSAVTANNTNILTVGVKYKLEYDVLSTNGVNLQSELGGIIYSTSSIGHKVQTFNATESQLYFKRTGITDVSIDNISVVEVLNSLDGTPTDATQTTSTLQPYLSGNIAPTERLCMKNPNGGSNYMTHPTISFAANEAWSVTTVLNANTSYGSVFNYCGSGLSSIGLNSMNLRIVNKNVSVFNIQLPQGTPIGKNNTLTVTYNGNNLYSLYVNGIFKSSLVGDGSFDFSFIVRGREFFLPGSISAHIIRAQALTPTQVAAEANFLRSLYPEIPSVTIGSQVWATSNCDMVATPQGNLIQNVTENANVEKITNGGFDTDTDWVKVDTTISGGLLHFNGVVSGTYAYHSTAAGIAGKYFKITFTVSNYVSGNIKAGIGGTQGVSISANGTYTQYILATNSTNRFIFNGYSSARLDIDNVSVQEVGWSDATNLYDYVYANTADTVEQKTYAAVKAAAMWCYYNNDVALGSTYGKLLNDYAIKLMDMDIAYYNAANPTTPWGWGIPTEVEWNTLEATINNDAEAIKHAGTTYWSAPNAGTNSTGFTALPAGYRKEDGTFAGLNTTALFCSTDMSVPRIGKSLRLIKR